MDKGLLDNLDKIHSTELGIIRIKKNLNLSGETDVVSWCKAKIKTADKIVRKGKNYYAYSDDAILTINAHSFTIITAHRKKAVS